MADYGQLLDMVYTLDSDNGDFYSERSGNKECAKALTAGAISGAVFGTIAVVIKHAMKLRDIKNIEKSKELTSIWNDLVDREKELKSYNKELHIKNKEYRRKYKYYKKLEVLYGKRYQYSQSVTFDGPNYTTISTNPLFDPKKAAEYNELKKEISKMKSDIKSDISDMKKLLKEIKSLSKKLRSIAKSNEDSIDKNTLDGLFESLYELDDRIMESEDRITRQDYWFNESSYDFDMLMESTDSNDDKSPFEELEERIEAIKKKKTRGFISDEEANEQLSEVQKKLKEVKEKLDSKNE